jgi:hypothetical protein
MSAERPRVERETRIIEAMIRLYCRDHHPYNGDLCPDCRELMEYARKRLDKCVFQEGKTTCVQCPVHCFRAEQREMTRVVMRYAGPRMTWRHPIMALRHMIDGRRKEPIWPRKKKKKQDEH